MKAFRRLALALWCCGAGVAHADVNVLLDRIPGTADSWAYLGLLNGSQVARFTFQPTQQSLLNYSIIIETDAADFSPTSFTAGMTAVDGAATMKYVGVTDANKAQYTFNGVLKGAEHTVSLDFSNLAFSGHLTTVSIAANPLVYRVADYAATVPEPGTGVLLLLGLPLLARRLMARRVHIRANP